MSDTPAQSDEKFRTTFSLTREAYDRIYEMADRFDLSLGQVVSLMVENADMEDPRMPEKAREMRRRIRDKRYKIHKR